jgi:predicted TIM-barrel fold metal-dependent hydrolase
MKHFRLLAGVLIFPLVAPAQDAEEKSQPDKILLKDFRPRAIHKVPITTLTKAKFPVIDMHAHHYARTPEALEGWVRTMDEMGVEKAIVMTGAKGGQFDEQVAFYGKYRDRFSIWCGFDLSDSDKPDFAAKSVAELERCVKAGAEGVGELSDKGGGLRGNHNPPSLHIDDPRMDALIEKCADLGIPINIHVAEPKWMYEPMDKTNDGMMTALKWRLDDKKEILGHAEVVATLERAVKKHPRTTFIACHFANCCYDLSILARMFDACPNLYADIGARYAETAPIPRYMAKFYEKYQDRILYGTDMTFSKEMYLTTFRILETEDEHFYDWSFFRYHWPLHGFGLKDETLKKIYAENARKILKK